MALTVRETWRIDDEWWRVRPVSRAYFSLLLEDGRMMTLYYSLLADQWLQQDYRQVEHDDRFPR